MQEGVKMKYPSVYQIVHLLWTFCLVIICGLKFVWSYDWSVSQDTIVVLMMFIAIIYEWIILKKQKLHNVGLWLLYDIFISLIVGILPFFFGNPTTNYIVCNIFIPIAVIGVSVMFRFKKTSHKT